MPRVVIGILFVVIITYVGLWGWEYYKMEKNIQEKEDMKIDPKIFAGSVREVGYILDFRSTREFSSNIYEDFSNHFLFNEKKIIWWVKIPSTNKVYACDYQGGYLGFIKDEGVELIHPDEEKVDPNGNYDGYIVGLHEKSKGRATSVWAVDVEDYEDDIADFENSKK